MTSSHVAIRLYRLSTGGQVKFCAAQHHPGVSAQAGQRQAGRQRSVASLHLIPERCSDLMMTNPTRSWRSVAWDTVEERDATIAPASGSGGDSVILERRVQHRQVRSQRCVAVEHDDVASKAAGEPLYGRQVFRYWPDDRLRHLDEPFVAGASPGEAEVLPPGQVMHLAQVALRVASCLRIKPGPRRG